MTECKTEQYEFHPLGNREVVGRFDGGDITTDAGGLLLREVEQRTGIIRRFAACFRDYRDPRFTEFTVEELVAQRVYGLGLGYEDLNDHDQLRADPALAVIVGKEDPKGEHRRVEQDRGKALAGKSTLNRLELTGVVDELKRIVAQIRTKWPKVRIVLRADSGFCREDILAWCEGNDVDYVIGLAKNEVLIRNIEKELEKASKKFEKTGQPARLFKEFQYRTKESWSRHRRVIAKAEHLEKGANPRFIVTSLPSRQMGARYIYERTYCARGDMENRIKEQQLGLFADRTSTATMRANQLRLYFSSVAYMLIQSR